MITSKIFMWNVDKGLKTLIGAFFQKNLRGGGGFGMPPSTDIKSVINGRD